MATTIAIATRARDEPSDPWVYHLEFTPNRDYLDGEVEVSGTQAVQVSPLIRADDVAIYARGNLAVTYTWTRVLQFSDYWETYQELQTKMVEFSGVLAANALAGNLEAKIEVYNSTPTIAQTTTYDHAAFETITPRILGPTLLAITYTLICSNPS